MSAESKALSGNIDSIALEHCRAWAERAALLKQRRALVCEYEEHDSDHACWAGGRAYYGPAMEELHERRSEDVMMDLPATRRLPRLSALILAVTILGACRPRPDFWDGEVFVVNPDRRASEHHCTVAGTLMLGRTGSWAGMAPVLDDSGKPVKCRWMTEEETDQ